MKDRLPLVVQEVEWAIEVAVEDRFRGCPNTPETRDRIATFVQGEIDRYVAEGRISVALRFEPKVTISI